MNSQWLCKLYSLRQVHDQVLCSNHFKTSESKSMRILMMTMSWFDLSWFYHHECTTQRKITSCQSYGCRYKVIIMLKINEPRLHGFSMGRQIISDNRRHTVSLEDIRSYTTWINPGRAGYAYRGYEGLC